MATAHRLARIAPRLLTTGPAALGTGCHDPVDPTLEIEAVAVLSQPLTPGS
jgi:hypothetical protein